MNKKEDGPYPQKATGELVIRHSPINKFVHVDVYRKDGILARTHYIEMPYEIEKIEVKEVFDPSWYKLPADVFDPLVNDPSEFYRTVRDEYKEVHSVWFENRSGYIGYSITKQCFAGGLLANLYRAGIIRQGGAMPDKTDYTKAFSIKDGEMVVDWDMLEVTEDNALEISIESWKWMYEWLQENGGYIRRDETQCALCQLYYGKNNCAGCPVHNNTRSGCLASPILKYHRANDHHESLDAAREEIEFLESLIEDEK